MRIDEKLEGGGPIVLDGGLSNALEAKGFDLNHPLWTAKLLAEDPEALLQAHYSYLEAGADCIITGSYQATLPGLQANGYSLEAAEDLLRQTTGVAQTAVERFEQAYPKQRPANKNRPLVAASIGPYGAYLADGSEYRGRYSISRDELKAFHRDRLAMLDSTAPDLLACETIPSFEEGQVLAELLSHAETPAWLSFSCQDEAHLNDGTPMKTCAQFLANQPQVAALGVNCTAPRYITSLIHIIRDNAPGQKIVVYPNSGAAYDPLHKTWKGLADPHDFGAMARQWFQEGASLVGGCCQIGPKHIQQVKAAIAGG
jgi:homocysteine S-methyltransferase